ncbi:MAG: sugar ABC transporter permease [Actinomycetes bacterium]
MSIGLLKNSAAKRPKKLKVSHNVSFLSALPWIGPALLLILLVVIWPVIELIRTSFTDISLAGSLLDFNGLVNYRDLLANVDLYPVAKRTLFWVFGIVFFTVLLSLPLAQLINQNFPGRKYVRWAMIFPWAASVVMTSMIWTWILDAYSGELNLTLTQLGLISEPVDWVNNPGSSFYFLMWVAVFVSIPFTTFVLLAGLQSIPQDIIEAASVDGATSWQTYRRVKFPLLRNSLLIATIINLINVFNSFPIIWVMTRGGPGYETDTTTSFAYKLAFIESNMGQSTALGVFNFIVIMIIVGFYLKITKATRTEL